MKSSKIKRTYDCVYCGKIYRFKFTKFLHKCISKNHTFKVAEKCAAASPMYCEPQTYYYEEIYEVREPVYVEEPVQEYRREADLVPQSNPTMFSRALDKKNKN